MSLKFPLILDGATGTRLQAAGMPEGVCSERWILDHPQVLEEIQRGYVAAGTQMLLAPTFGANPISLAKHGISEVEDYNLQLVQLSRRAAGGNALVAADISPTGKLIAPFGDSSVEEMYLCYRRQVAALEKAGVDAFVIETMMALPEIRAALMAVRELSDKPVIATMTLEPNGRTLTGGSPVAALITLQAMGADVFGLNCSTGPDRLSEHLKALTAYAKIPLAAKPNAGLPEYVNGKTVFNLSAEDFAAHVPGLAAAGVRVFGGCCGTDDRHILALSEAVSAMELSCAAKPASGEWLASEREWLALEELEYRVVPCDEDLEDALLDAEGEPLCISIEDEEQLEQLEEAIHAATGILGFAAEDPAILDRALMLYNGRAFVRGSLPAAFSEKYGAVAVD